MKASNKPLNLTELVSVAVIEKEDAGSKPSRLSKNGMFLIHDDPPALERASTRGYPWRELAIGQAFFAPNPGLKVSKSIRDCENRKFITYAGEHEGVKGRWAKRVK